MSVERIKIVCERAEADVSEKLFTVAAVAAVVAFLATKASGASAFGCLVLLVLAVAVCLWRLDEAKARRDLAYRILERALSKPSQPPTSVSVRTPL